MRAIYKYPIGPGKTTIRVPKYSTYVSALAQEMSIVVYFMFDVESRETEEATFMVVGTGHPFDDVMMNKHVATLQLGPLVCHVFKL